VVDDRVIQLTWQEHTALVYQLSDFKQLTTFTYDTEGLGLCDDGARLVMSDGTNQLYFRNRSTFAGAEQGIRDEERGAPGSARTSSNASTDRSTPMCGRPTRSCASIRRAAGSRPRDRRLRTTQRRREAGAPTC
jgi:hypothetical protein